MESNRKLYRVTMADNRSQFYVIAMHESLAVALAEDQWDKWKYSTRINKVIRVEIIAEATQYPRPSCGILLEAICD